MKKAAAVFLASSLAFGVSGQVFAEQIKEPAPVVQNVDAANVWKVIDHLKATVNLHHEKYTVVYDEKDGIVTVDIKKHKDHKVIKVTGKEANQRVIDFIKDLNLSMDLSKEEVINRLSDALGVKPSEVEKANAKVEFTNQAKLSFSYKKGEKSNVADPYQIRKLKVHVKANNGTQYDVHMSGKNSMQDTFIKKTKDGMTILKGSHARDEFQRIKNELTPTKDTTWKEYVSKISDVLGVEVTDITKADVDLQFENHAKVDVKFHR